MSAVAELTAQIEEITQSESFTKLRHSKNHTQTALNAIELAYTEAKRTGNPEVIYRTGQKLLFTNNNHERSLIEFNIIQDRIAALVEERENLLTAEDQANGTYVLVDQDRLGTARRVASYESGTREWLEQRQGGMGGSDVGKALELSEEYGRSDARELFLHKISPITDESVALQDVEGTAAARGNSWEEAIVRRFAENHPEFIVGHCKDSWENVDRPYQKANVDGLLRTREDIDWTGALEIKTSTRPQDWDNGAVPLGYIAQGLWYLDCFGFDFFYVAVIIDSVEYREFRFEKSQTIPVRVGKEIQHLTIEEARPLVEEFYGRVEQARKEIEKGAAPEELVPTRGVPIQRGTPRSVTASRVAHLNAFRQDTVGEALTSDQADTLMALYENVDPALWGKNIVAIDLETTRLSPRKGHIIELGLTERDHRGNEVACLDILCGIPEPIIETHGTGAVEVHGITVDDVRTKPTFDRVASVILERLQGRVILAHNASFEKNWLSQHIPGFVEADIPFIDTMQLATLFMPELPNSQLNTVCDALGVPYTNGHRAFHDAEVTAEAFFAMIEKRIVEKRG